MALLKMEAEMHQVVRGPVIDGHGLDSDGDPGCFLRSLGNFNVVLGAFGNGSSFFEDSSTIMWITSLMFFNASSLVRPEVAAPMLSECGAVGAPRRIAQGIFVRHHHDF
jgi:hypothetical protein